MAFDATTARRPVILQHLLLGMNAHINLDLGVCASELADPGMIDAIRADFDAVNDVLAELVDGCQNALGEVSPWLGLVDRIGGSGDEAVIRFSLDDGPSAGVEGCRPAVVAHPVPGGTGDRRRRRRRGRSRPAGPSPRHRGERACSSSSDHASGPSRPT